MPVPLAAHIPALYSLANTPLSYDVVRSRCRELGWSIPDEDRHNVVLRVQFDNAVSVFVASLGPGQKFGRTIYLPLYFTDDAYDCITGFPPDAKPDFDAAYALALSLFEGKIGPALRTGTFDYFHGTYRFAVWRGTCAVLALIQDDFDIQFGSEITAWVIECGADDPLSLAEMFPNHQGLAYLAADAALLAGDETSARRFFIRGFRLDPNASLPGGPDWGDVLSGTEWHLEYRLHLLRQTMSDYPEEAAEDVAELISEYGDDPDKVKVIHEVANGGEVPQFP